VPVVVPDLVLDDRGTPVNGQTSGVLITDTGWVTPIVSGLADGRHRVWTPCARQADIGGGRVITEADIVLDPGHGGSETGAVGKGGLREADLNLEFSLKLRDVLVGAGYSVVMTRQTDVRVPIATRAEIARALDPLAFISIHFNAGTDAPSDTPGTEMYHQIDNPASKRLAGLIYEEAYAVLARYDIDWVALNDAGAMIRPNEDGDDYYGVLRRPGPVPSVLTEYAYLSNPAEEELVSDPEVQQELIDATFSAIERFATTEDPGSGFVDEPIFRGYGPSGAGGTANCTEPALE
jgi:N-acetylmuramoyl-L-alanine amidase